MAATIRELNDAQNWSDEWQVYEENLKNIRENQYKQLLTITDEYCKAQNVLQKNVEMQRKNLKAFSNSFERIRKSGANGGSGAETLQKMSDQMSEARSMFDDFDEALPKTAGWFLKACIGEINVSLFQKKQHYKDVYEKFKLKTMILAMFLSVINLTLIHTRFMDAMFNGLLVWYYSSLTLQEQILRANGSRIKGWYLAHHYLSILLSGFLLIWPATESYQQFRTQFYIFAMYLSFVQCLQYHYQSGAMYRRRALGHGKPMDVTQDGVGLWHTQRLIFLVPFLAGGQLFELYNAYSLWMISTRVDCHEWQVIASAVLFLVVAVGNIITLIIVLRQKFLKNVPVVFPC